MANTPKTQPESDDEIEIHSLKKLLTTSQHKVIIFDWDDTLFCTKYLEMLKPDYEAIFKGRSCLEDLGSYLLDEVSMLERVKSC